MISLVLAILLATSVIGLPTTSSKRFSTKPEDASTTGANDVTILTYALTLEHLEDAFYREGLANFTQSQFAAAGFDAAFYANLQRISVDETTHVQYLEAGLTAARANVAQECTYKFPYTDPSSFIALASILEGVGVSAYLGAAAYIASADYLTAAASILTIEARHSSYLRAQIGEEPYPAPFDSALDFNQVYSLAAPFFLSCPSTNPPLGVSAFPRLDVAAEGPIVSGSIVNLTTAGYVLVGQNPQSANQLYAAFVTPLGPIFQPVMPEAGSYSVEIPTGINGQTYVVLTACSDKLADSTTLAGPAILEIDNPALTSST